MPSRLLSAVAMLLFQTMLNVFGAVDLLPLTGVTFPFVSMGGSSMIASLGPAGPFSKPPTQGKNASFLIKLPQKNPVKKAAPTQDSGLLTRCRISRWMISSAKRTPPIRAAEQR